MTRNEELCRLSQATWMIARAEAAVMEQIAEFDRLRVRGCDTALAERNLRALTSSLQALRDRRELTARTIWQIDRGMI